MKIAVGNSRMDKKWKNRDISWEDLCQRVSSTIRTTETVEEYRKLKKGAQDNIKDVGGFVGGQLREGRRKNGMVLCRSMLTPLGAFNNSEEDFDPKRHSLEARLIPSPRLQQCAASCSVENTGKGKSTVDPVIAQVSLAFKAKIAAAERPFNQIPAGRPNQLSIHGKNLKLMGSHPEVGITIRCLATGESYFFPLNKKNEDQLVANSVSRLCILPRITFTPGTWEVSVATQYSRTYKPVKYLRIARRQFEVYNKP